MLAAILVATTAVDAMAGPCLATAPRKMAVGGEMAVCALTMLAPTAAVDLGVVAAVGMAVWLGLGLEIGMVVGVAVMDGVADMDGVGGGSFFEISESSEQDGVLVVVIAGNAAEANVGAAGNAAETNVGAAGTGPTFRVSDRVRVRFGG